MTPFIYMMANSHFLQTTFWISLHFLCFFYLNITNITRLQLNIKCCRGHDRMVVGFTTTCAISADHH
jgi:hypothetical protein